MGGIRGSISRTGLSSFWHRYFGKYHSVPYAIFLCLFAEKPVREFGLFAHSTSSLSSYPAASPSASLPPLLCPAPPLNKKKERPSLALPPSSSLQHPQQRSR